MRFGTLAKVARGENPGIGCIDPNANTPENYHQVAGGGYILLNPIRMVVVAWNAARRSDKSGIDICVHGACGHAFHNGRAETHEQQEKHQEKLRRRVNRAAWFFRAPLTFRVTSQNGAAQEALNLKN